MTNVVDMGIQQSDMQQKILRIETQQEINEKRSSTRFCKLEQKVDQLEVKLDKLLDIMLELKKSI